MQRYTVRIPFPDLCTLPPVALRRLKREGAFWTPPVVGDSDCPDAHNEACQAELVSRSPRDPYRRATANAEAVVGGVLQALGFKDLHFEKAFHGKTPDWRDSIPTFILDVYARRPGQAAIKWLMDDEAGEFEEAVSTSDRRRIEAEFRRKSEKYRHACTASQCPLVLAVSSLPMTMTGSRLLVSTDGDSRESILDALFRDNPHLGAVLLTEPAGTEHLQVSVWINPNCCYEVPEAFISLDSTTSVSLQ